MKPKSENGTDDVDGNGNRNGLTDSVLRFSLRKVF